MRKADVKVGGAYMACTGYVSQDVRAGIQLPRSGAASRVEVLMILSRKKDTVSRYNYGFSTYYFTADAGDRLIDAGLDMAHRKSRTSALDRDPEGSIRAPKAGSPLLVKRWKDDGSEVIEVTDTTALIMPWEEFVERDRKRKIREAQRADATAEQDAALEELGERLAALAGDGDHGLTYCKSSWSRRRQARRIADRVEVSYSALARLIELAESERGEA